MKKCNKILVLGLFATVLVSSLSACKKKTESVDLSSTHTTAASETMATTAAESKSAETIAPTTKAADKLEYKIETYKNNSIKISYPSISGMADSSKEEAVNSLLKTNALSVIAGCDVDEANDSLEVKTEVVSLDSKRIVVTYFGTHEEKGAAHPGNLFYSNTVDLNSCKDIGFSDYSDAYTMAGYVLSDDVEVAADKEIADEFLELRKKTTLDEYTKMFENADFPIDTSSDGKISYKNWPFCFSYQKDGDMYFSIPTEHAIGDYVLIKYSPQTK